MKKMLCFLFYVALFMHAANAKIWRVNNNPGIAANFTTVQAAHDGAASGDTIHLEGSPNTYGGLTCSKKLFIVGPGYFLDQHPNTQALQQSAQVSTVTLNVGSEGTVITGLDFRGSGIQVYSNDIVIRRNNFASPNGTNSDYLFGAIYLQYLNTGGYGNPVSNIIITQNYGVRINSNYASTNILITSNYIGYGTAYGETTTNSCLDLQANSVALIQNNIFRNGTVQVYNSNLSNNIMYAGFYNGTNNLSSNNIANGTQFGTANGNQSNVSMSSVFLLSGAGDDQWKLGAGSLAIGAGYGSTAQNPVDCGMYGGNTPYVIAGQANMPAIYSFENQPIGSNTDPIKAKINVKSAGN